MGHYGGDYRASIGGWVDTPKGHKWLPPSKVIVDQVQGVKLSPTAVFSLSDLYAELRREVDGKPIQGSLF